MKCPYKITISNKNLYREFEISEDVEKVCLGTTSGCEFRLNGDDYFETIELTFSRNQDEWQVICNDAIYLSKGDVRKLGFCKVTHGDSLMVRYASNGSNIFELGFSIDFEAQIPKFNKYIDISSLSQIKIGTDNNVDISIESNYCDEILILIENDRNELYVSEKQSPYGVYLNGRKIEKRMLLESYDFISVSDVFFYYKDSLLYYDKSKVNSNNHSSVENESESVFEYPVFVRNTKRKLKLDDKAIKILDPSAQPTKPEMHIVTSLMPTIIMFILVVVLRGIMSTTMGTYIIFSICSMGLGVFTSIAGLVQGQKKYKEDVKNREEVYKQYIEKKEKEIQELRKVELEVLYENYFPVEKAIEKVLKFDSDIFDRIPEDEDFLDVYLGVGLRKSRKQIDYKIQEKLELGDELTHLPNKLCEKYMYIKNAPITVSVRNAGAIGIIGNKEECYQLFKNVLADIVCRQFMSDTSIYLLLENNVSKYDWVKTLPQLQKKNGARNIVFDNNSRTNVFEDLYKELTFRSENKGNYNHIIVFVLEDNEITNHPISKFIKDAANIQTTFIFFERSIDFLPLYCSSVIELEKENRGTLYKSQDKTKSESFIYGLIDDSKMAALVKKIAPVHAQEISLASTLRKNISMFEMLGIYEASDIDLEKQWKESKVYESMAAPLGVNAKNEIVYLDLHEKAHGPHGLVAGTTGSGKSEILQSYILSIALRFHPYEIGFVIIDFKGGGMANQFRNLPHLIGTITNIDGKEINRSLKSIKAELLRRQELFAKAGVNQIDKYIKLYKANEVSDPLPHLVIIVDEFAELKAEQPEFMKELISAARIGRSLGVHLILATQKPAGQVNEQIWSNSKFKLCLKVQDQQDSKEVIKSPLAAEIKEPGRAYLQVGNNEIFELFQSAYSGGSSVREDETTQKKFTIYRYDMSGRKGILFEQKQKKTQKAASTELEALVDQVALYCNEKHIERLPNICLPSLKDQYLFQNDDMEDRLMNVPVGVYDDPDHQYQGVYVTDIGNENTIVIGSSQMGKTNFLQLVIRYLALHNSSQDVNFYILDFGSMILKNFEKLNHVGGVVLASEDEKIKNLFKLLVREMDIRKGKLMDKGVSSFQAYREAGFTDMPKIYILVDNFNASKELYMDQYEQIFVRICRDGISLGISTIITNASTTGIGYRYLSNFSNRICFTCNEVSDYSTLLTRCRTEPKAVAGRMLFQKDKEIYEAQSYLAFEGVKEIDRAESVRKFVIDMNDIYEDDEVAKMIPCIPDVLNLKDFKKNYFNVLEPAEIPLGLDFATIEPIMLSTKEDFEFALIARKREKIKAFMKSFCKIMQMSKGNSFLKIYVLDGIERELKYLKENPLTQRYSIESSESELVIEDVLENLKANKYNMISEDGNKNEFTTNIIIVNSKETMEYISSTKPVLEKFKEIYGSYKNYGVLFVYAAVENATVAYNGPELLKRIKENKKALVLDNINTVKIFDIPANQIRAFSKEILSDEGYWINGTEVQKVKLLSTEG